ncbi:hypothetical protein EWM64_g869 [Hericium alpestre]|uniref:Peptidase C14 caspase domain-containing protein n=1 Tax=Hericium alpestre TaxID=135208 RepID=A0A4Z0A7V4_9AGAM|nr:hypothetical protein EWM64_g869 [Hericium alpestre]
MPQFKPSRLNVSNPFLNWQPFPWEGRRKALLIGISYQLHVSTKYPELIGPPKDVRKIRKLLMDQYSFRDDQIVMMTDDDPTMLTTDLWPTRENIVKQIQVLVKGAKANDFFIFHYSGHCGQQEATDDLNEVDGKDEVLIGCDFLGLVDDDIHKELVSPLPRRSRLTVRSSSRSLSRRD